MIDKDWNQRLRILEQTGSQVGSGIDSRPCESIVWKSALVVRRGIKIQNVTTIFYP